MKPGIFITYHFYTEEFFIEILPKSKSIDKNKQSALNFLKYRQLINSND